MRAYYFDNLPGDQRLPHDSARPVSLDALKSLNLLYMNIPVDGYEERIATVAEEGDYKNHDIISISKEGLGDLYDAKIKAFYEEHMHEDDELRYLLAGSGYFDIRGAPVSETLDSVLKCFMHFAEAPTDSWIRLALTAGDLIALPAGIYHRFTLDTSDNVRTVRLFKDVPKWTALNRGPETENHPIRIAYLKSLGTVTTV
ncbi:Acireductone dioxygenase [Guyanagaster necrorhizus]|uniref:Acireductone dioxygenase n=1 Tax=Guyanagaster necrorhizus TaxID=856835 RepID=A0A9P7W2Q6_9AGAR|nr:Acireductone dioxygenase [Guyanagaster necrorhizus MCA 3950]KAG7452266.1 Acireductone dioxygenase [Guyanagaster necrorhizus MCA 3950]